MEANYHTTRDTMRALLTTVCAGRHAARAAARAATATATAPAPRRHAATAAFQGSFTQQEPIPSAGIAAAVAVLESGRLHRYNVADGEASHAALLEAEYAAYQGSTHALACSSGGFAMQLALAVTPGFEAGQGQPVLTNAFTLSPVPGAISGAGGAPVLVETTRDLTIDLQDLEGKIKSSGARVLLLSHMRGHLVDMDRLCALLDTHGVALIEDCAHTMGASWDGKKSGSFGAAACFSTQTYKHINSGEGGLLVTDDDVRDRHHRTHTHTPISCFPVPCEMGGRQTPTACGCVRPMIDGG